MIYTRSENREFRDTKTAFTGAYRFILEEMFRTYKAKGESRDVGSPIHHRQSPQHQMAMARMKGWRIESAMSVDGWEGDAKTLEMIMEECGDAANFLVFVAALCSMLLAEVTEPAEPASHGRGGFKVTGG